MTTNANNILITGATGLIGQKLVERLERVVVTTRNAERAQKKLGNSVHDVVEWSDVSATPDLSPAEPVKAVINLMGESIANGRWTDEKKKRIRNSRVLGTRSLVNAIRNMCQRPDVLVSASAVGFYGDRDDRILEEQTAAGDGFLAGVCQQWEDAAKPVEELGVRLVTLRFGVVLSNDDGALARMRPIFKLGLGGKLGSGQQYFPWIHIEDLVSLILWSIKNEATSGIFNATAPNPVKNVEFTKTLARELNRPAFLTVPSFALKLALGEFATSLLESQNAIPANAVKQGFDFQFPQLSDALADLLV